MNKLIEQLVNKAWETRDKVSSTRAFDDCFIDSYTKVLVDEIAQFVYNHPQMTLEQGYTIRKDINERYFEK